MSLSCVYSPRVFLTFRSFPSLLCEHTGIRTPHVHFPSLCFSYLFSGFHLLREKRRFKSSRTRNAARAAWGRWWWRWWWRWWCGGGGGGGAPFSFFFAPHNFSSSFTSSAQDRRSQSSSPGEEALDSGVRKKKRRRRRKVKKGCGRRKESPATRQSLGGISCHLLRQQHGLSAPLSMPAQNNTHFFPLRAEAAPAAAWLEILLLNSSSDAQQSCDQRESKMLYTRLMENAKNVKKKKRWLIWN